MDRADLVELIFRKKTFLCVGLDPEIGKLPTHLRDMGVNGVLEFNKAIIDATREYAVAYKPNLAFFEALGPDGWRIFDETVRHIGPTHLVIADAKRGDIGNTSRMYADAFFHRYGCDAITVAPYMGEDSIKPFLDFKGKWTILLGLTSNTGSDDFQKKWLADERKPLWETVLQKAVQWGTPEQLMFVIGATHPEAFARVRTIAQDYFLLVPGVGAQGGDLAAICQHGLNDQCGLLVNASRSILYAGAGMDFAERAAAEAAKLQAEMAVYL